MRQQGIEATYPATPLQAGLLFHSLSAKGEGLYVQQLLGRLHEDLDTSAFAEAWRRIVQRHAILRTSFQLDRPERPIQVVSQEVAAPVHTRDWRRLEAPVREEELQRLLRADREAGFDFEAPPLTRLYLCRCAESEYELVWSYHHTLVDWRSRLIVVREMFALYEALRRGEPLDLPEPLPFRDFVEWLGTRDWSRAQAFWREMLRGIDDPTPLPRPLPSAAADGAEGPGEHLLRLPAATVRALERIARSHALTLGTILHGAWAALLSRESDREDVVFGVTRAGRRSLPFAADSTVGLLMATVPVRARLRAAAPLTDWLGELRAQSVAVREFEHAALTDVQRWSEVPRPRPLFESLVTFEGASFNSTLREENETFRSRDFEMVERDSYPLGAKLRKEDDELVAEVRFDGRRVNPTTAERILAGYGEVLEAFAREPGTRVGDLASTRAPVPDGGFARRRDDPRSDRGTSVVQVFAARVAERPHEVAVRFHGRTLTYAQLDAQSNRVAHALQAASVGHETLVGVFMERSLELVVALLAVLKAGGAYVPLDVDYPPARLRFMLDDTRAGVIVTQPHLAERLPASDACLIALDCGLTCVAGHAVDPPACTAGPASLAYVMYTSGTTGTPKGVQIIHRAVVRLVRGQSSVPLGPDDTVLHASPLTFDISTFEVWGALLNGGALAVHPPGPPSPDAIVRTIRENSVTTANLATGVFQQVVEFDLAGLRGLRQLLTGGDVLSVSHALRVLDELPACRFVNAFGPTEATTFACTHVVSPALGAEASSVPIGRPIAGARAEVLDPDGQLVVPEEEGELYLGGDGLARGYHRRPQLTAERFIPDPRRAGERLYRTGDRVRLRPDGELEFRGRVDEQVKIRGVRVEPGEVETAVRQHPAVAEAAVIARPAPGGHKRLVAYVVRRPNTRGAGPELRSFIAQRLPAPLVPSDFVETTAMPLTPNGKVDRATLAARDARQTGHRRALSGRAAPGGVAPLTRTQARLAAIWTELLEMEAPGLEDDFFELGGDSLLAVGLVARAADEFGVELSVADVFEASRLSELAARIDGAPAPVRSLPPIVPAARRSEAPLAPSQEGLWFVERLAPNPQPDRFCALLHLEGELDVDALTRALSALVERHEVLRTSLRGHNGSAVQVIHAPTPVELATVDYSQLDEHRQPAMLRELLYELLGDIRVDRPVLMRWRLVKLGRRRHALAHVQHHLVHDGWSWRVLVEELAEFYGAFVEGRAPSLPGPELQFADFAVWQRDVVESGLAREQLVWWRRKLTPPPAALPLPIDNPRPAHPTYAGATLREPLSASLRTRIASLSLDERTTSFTVMLAAFFALLHRHSGGAEDVCVAVPVANRRRPESERLLGLLANVVPLRVSLVGDPSLRELLRRVHDEAVAAHDRQDLPYHRVIEAVRVPRENGHAMLARVFFSLVEVPDEPKMPGLRVHVEDGLNDRATVADLVVSVHERTGGRTGTKGNRAESGDPANLVWGYSTDIFRPATARRMMADYRAILGVMVSDPDRQLSQLSGLLPSPAGDGRMPSPPPALRPATDRGGGRRAFVPPRDAVEARLARLWEDLLDARPIGVHDDFFDLGGHSLLALRLFGGIAEIFDRPLPVASLFEGPTIADLARRLRRPASVPGAPSSLVAIQPRGSKRPFFCVHEFFGDVVLYRNLARSLGEDQPFYALQPRGLHDAEQPFISIEGMAAGYVEAMFAVQAEGPYFLGGLCSGGIVAYEMARLLRAQGHAVGLVALLDAPAVGAKSRGSIRHIAQGVPDWARALGELTGDQRRELARLKIAMARAGVKRRFGELAHFRVASTHRQAASNRRPFKEVADLLQFSEHHRRVAEAQSRAIRAYNPRTYPGRLTLFRARLQPFFRLPPPDMGWGAFASAGVDVKVVPGNHSGMLQEPHVGVLARELSAYLEP